MHPGVPPHTQILRGLPEALRHTHPLPQLPPSPASRPSSGPLCTLRKPAGPGSGSAAWETGEQALRGVQGSRKSGVNGQGQPTPFLSTGRLQKSQPGCLTSESPCPAPTTAYAQKKMPSGLGGTSGFSHPSAPRREKAPCPGGGGRGGSGASCTHQNKERKPRGGPRAPLPGEGGPGPLTRGQRLGPLLVKDPCTPTCAQACACTSAPTRVRVTEQTRAYMRGADLWPVPVLQGVPSPLGRLASLGTQDVGPVPKGLPCAPSQFL